jgi:hypothetical protein
VGTDEGLCVFHNGSWYRLTVEDDLVWNDLNSDAFYEDADGSICIGTSGGVSHLLRPEELFQTEPPTPWITDARIGNTILTQNRSTEIPSGKQPLIAQLSSQDFRRESSIKFSYRMGGIREDWQDTPDHDLRYPPLPPGRYRLVVLAFDAFSGRQSTPVSISFWILPLGGERALRP